LTVTFSLMGNPSPIEFREPDSATNTETRLVSDVLAKDRKATAEFVSRCTDWIYPFVRRRLVPRTELVEDLMQEILLAAWQALPGFRAEADLRSWVLGIARHKLEDYYRKRIREYELAEESDPEIDLAAAPILEQQLDSAAQQEQVQKTLSALPEPYALVLLWRYRDEKSAREMAELTGKTEKAIERLLARARENFRRRWENA
jgi:RNA polymerase sigma-70 factor (ECF subfamily)